MMKNTKSNQRKTVQDVRRNTLLTKDTPFAMQEAYKALRTNVMFSLPGSDCKCVGITSPAPHEGKSTTAVNMAISLAQIDKRVLLIDADMRIPTIAGKLPVKAVPGLSDFLVGEAKIEEAVRSVEDYGIHVLPSGNIPPDPTGLLEAKQLEHLFSAIRKIYDYVIIDLPPVNTVPDAAIVSRYVDGYLMVVREKMTEHRGINEALRQLQLVKANVLGFVSVGGTVGKNKYYQYRG